MKTGFNIFILGFAAVIGLAIGVAIRNRPVSNSSERVIATSSSTVIAPAKLFGNVKHSAPAVDDSPLATKLSRDLSMSKGVTRWLYWLDAVEKAALSDFPRLAKLAKDNPAAQRLVADRWIQLSPRHFYDTLVAAAKAGELYEWRDLGYMLFQEWPKRDMDAAIAALNEPSAVGVRSLWRNAVATQVMDKDPERALRLMSEWSIESYGPRMTAAAKWAAADPRHAAEFTLKTTAGYASRLTMETVAKEWAKTDPRGALQLANANPGALGSTLAQTTLKEWAGRNLNDAADWLASSDASTRNRLSAAFVEAWAKKDSSSALTWSEANLAGSALAQAVSGVMRGAAEKDPAGAAAMVADMGASPARADAAAAVARKLFPGLSTDNAATPETIAWLGKLDSESVKSVLNEVQWQWATSDAKSMANFLNGLKSSDYPETPYVILARQMARNNPMDAFEWASHLPEDRGLSAGAEAFGEWAHSQSEVAMKWLNELPESDPRRQPFLERSIRNLAYDQRAAERFDALTDAQRTTARDVIAKMSTLPDDRRTRLLEILKAK